MQISVILKDSVSPEKLTEIVASLTNNLQMEIKENNIFPQIGLICGKIEPINLCKVSSIDGILTTNAGVPALYAEKEAMVRYRRQGKRIVINNGIITSCQG